MRARPVLALVAVAAVAFLAAAGVTRAVAHRGEAADTTRAAGATGAARTTFPDLVAAAGEPTLPSLERLRPAPGTVAQAAGPFDDRLVLRGLSFDGAHVRGAARVTTDVSDLLELEALAGFYDRQGRLIGTARHVHHLDESVAGAQGHVGPPTETERFAIAVPERLRGTAVSAAVGVPVLVNE